MHIPASLSSVTGLSRTLLYACFVSPPSYLLVFLRGTKSLARELSVPSDSTSSSVLSASIVALIWGDQEMALFYHHQIQQVLTEFVSLSNCNHYTQK